MSQHGTDDTGNLTVHWRRRNSTRGVAWHLAVPTHSVQCLGSLLPLWPCDRPTFASTYMMESPPWEPDSHSCWSRNTPRVVKPEGSPIRQISPLHASTFVLFVIAKAIKSRVMKWSGHVVHEEMRNVYKILIEQLQRKIPSHRWKDNTKMDLRGKRCDGVNWIQQTQDRVQSELFWTEHWILRINLLYR
jgi:hypothetical protein